MKRTHSIWKTQKTDTSPVRRFRFTENEWKLILEAVQHYVEHIATVQGPPFKKIQYDLINHSTEDSELGEKWREAVKKLGELHYKICTLEGVERQLLLAFKVIQSSWPRHAYTHIERRVI